MSPSPLVRLGLLEGQGGIGVTCYPLLGLSFISLHKTIQGDITQGIRCGRPGIGDLTH